MILFWNEINPSLTIIQNKIIVFRNNIKFYRTQKPFEKEKEILKKSKKTNKQKNQNTPWSDIGGLWKHTILLNFLTIFTVAYEDVICPEL